MKVTIKLEGETPAERAELTAKWHRRAKDTKGLVRVPIRMKGEMMLSKLYPFEHLADGGFIGGEVEFMFDGTVSDGLDSKLCPLVSPCSGQEGGR